MKLISCHIKNFGKLTNVDYDFQTGIQTFIKENGWGKSTLTDFIKAMLYGLDKVTTATKDFKDRTHYAPFNKQSFGGTLIFEHDNKKYRVEKTFDVKSVAKDETKIYVDDELCNFDKEIGEEILKLDKDSFERLISINQNDIKLEATSNIQKSLNNILSSDVVGVDCESLKAKVESVRKEFTKKNGKTAQCKKRIEDLQKEIKEKKDIEESLKRKNKEYNEKHIKLKQLNEEQKKFDDTKIIKANLDQYNHQLEAIKENENKLKELRGVYKNDLPSSEEISVIQKTLTELTTCEGQLKGISFDKEKEVKLQNLNDKYSFGAPTEVEIQSISELEKERKTNLISLENLKISEDKKEDFSKLNERFKERVPSFEECKQVGTDVIELNNQKFKLQDEESKELSSEQKEILALYNEKDLEGTKQSLEKLKFDYENVESKYSSSNVNQVTTNKAKRSKSLIATSVLFLITLVAGIGVLFVHLISGLILIGVSILFLLFDGFLYLKNKIDSNLQNTNESEFKQKVYNEKTNIEQSIKQILAKFNIYPDNIYEGIANFINDVKSYNNILSTIDIKKQEITKLHDTIDTLSTSIMKIISKYGYQEIKDATNFKNDAERYITLKKEVDEFNTKYNELRQKAKSCFEKEDQIFKNYQIELSLDTDIEALIKEIGTFNTLKVDYGNSKRRTEQIKSKLSEHKTTIENFEEKHLLKIENNESLTRIASDIATIKQLDGIIEKSKKQAIEFKEKNSVDENVILEELADHSGDIIVLNREILTLERDIDTNERYVNDLSDNESELKLLNEELDKMKRKVKILQKVEEILETSQKTLDAKYVEPILNKFNTYIAALGDVLGVKLIMAKNFELKIEVDGELKNIDHLSSGQKGLCALCFRLALLDNIYNDKVPFIVMDDPFVSLDENNLKSVKELINKISNNKQILYFTCHESRKI